MFVSIFQIIYDTFEEIYNKYKTMVTNLAYSILKDEHYSEDALQETMTKLSKCRDKLESLNENACHHFVYTTARNATIDIYRKRKKDWDNEIIVHFLENEPLCNMEGVSDIAAFASMYGFSESMVAALNELSFQDKDIICYKYGAGYNAREIGQILDRSPDYINKRLQRAEKKLAQILKSEHK